MEAVIPPPEEVEDVETALEAAEVKQPEPRKRKRNWWVVSDHA